MNIFEFILNNNNYSKDLITRYTYNSNAIERSTLTYAETYAILYNDNSFKINGKEPREIYEAINHKVYYFHLYSFYCPLPSLDYFSYNLDPIYSLFE